MRGKPGWITEKFPFRREGAKGVSISFPEYKKDSSYLILWGFSKGLAFLNPFKRSAFPWYRVFLFKSVIWLSICEKKLLWQFAINVPKNDPKMNCFGFIHGVISEPYSSKHFSAKRDYAKQTCKSPSISNYGGEKKRIPKPFAAPGATLGNSISPWMKKQLHFENSNI